MPNRISPRVVFAIIGFVCLGLLSTAWFLQYGPDRQQPCPLCILQRYAYMAMAVVCLIAAAHNPRRPALLAYALVADLLATLGAGFAVWQVLKGGSMTSCLADPIGEFVNGLPTANWWPEFLFATGGCADKVPPVLGIAVPVWSLIWFMSFMALLGLILVHAVQRKANS